MVTTTKQHYFNVYWKQQDRNRVSRRAEWRAMQLYKLIGHRFRTLLDIGAGQGELLTYFRSAGYRVEGWDVSTEAVHSLELSGYPAKVVDLENDPFEGKFDIVTCCEVLQHLDDPAAVLRKVSDILSPNGRLFFTVPNEFHIVRQMGIGTPDESHIQLFSPRKAIELANISGYTVEERLYQPLIPPRWGKIASFVGSLLAKLAPSMFSLATMILAKRTNDN